MKKKLIDYQYMIQKLDTYAPENFLFRYENWEMIYWKFAYAFVGLALYESESFEQGRISELPLPAEFHFCDEWEEGPYEEGDNSIKNFSRNQLFEDWNTKVYEWVSLLDNVSYLEDAFDICELSMGFREHLMEELEGIILMNCGLEPEALADVLDISLEEAEKLLFEQECAGDWIYDSEGVVVFDYSEMEKLCKKITIKDNKTHAERAFMISYDKLLHSEFIQYMAMYSDFYSDGEESKKYYSMLTTCEPLEVNRIESFDPFHIIHYLVCKERYSTLVVKGDEICEQCQISA